MGSFGIDAWPEDDWLTIVAVTEVGLCETYGQDSGSGGGDRGGLWDCEQVRFHCGCWVKPGTQQAAGEPASRLWGG